jgi:hypothetical protein
MASDRTWVDRDAGRVARPYTVTGGRTRPRGETRFDLIDVVVAANAIATDGWPISPECIRIVQLSQRPITVADLASGLGLPLGVVRVLLGDLLHEGMIKLLRPPPRGQGTDENVLRKVLDGLQAL